MDKVDREEFLVDIKPFMYELINYLSTSSLDKEIFNRFSQNELDSNLSHLIIDIINSLNLDENLQILYSFDKYIDIIEKHLKNTFPFKLLKACDIWIKPKLREIPQDFEETPELISDTILKLQVLNDKFSDVKPYDSDTSLRENLLRYNKFIYEHECNVMLDAIRTGYSQIPILLYFWSQNKQ